MFVPGHWLSVVGRKIVEGGIAFCLLPFAYCLLPTAYSPLATAACMASIVIGTGVTRVIRLPLVVTLSMSPW